MTEVPFVAAWRGSWEQAATLEGVRLATSAFRLLERVVPPARWAPWRDAYNWQYLERLPSQAILQKFARQLSTLTALDVLLDRGMVQEVGSMQRMLDEIAEDIMFLGLGITTGKWTLNHVAYLEHFWSEDARVAGVQRKSIRAFVNRAFPDQVDPSKADGLGRELYQVFSDFLHARSSALVSMISGPPPRYHLAGIFDEEATRSFRDQAPSYGYRCVMSAAIATRAIENGPLAAQTYAHLEEYGERYAKFVGA